MAGPDGLYRNVIGKGHGKEKERTKKEVTDQKRGTSLFQFALFLLYPIFRKDTV